MSHITRRNFLEYSASAVAASAFAPAAVHAASAGESIRAAGMHTLGDTGIQCSYLGIGTGIRGSGHAITRLTLELTGNEIVELLEYAYDRGVTYFDLADRYGSHHHMRLALRRSVPRDKVMLLSKVWSRDADDVKRDIERFRQELETDYIDVVLLHCIRPGEEDWPETLKPAMDVLSDAKAQGIIKAHGVSCHILPALERVADEPWCDVALVRVNPFNVNMDGPVETIVPIMQRIHDAGKGVLGMKILGEGAPAVVEKMDECLQFAVDLPCMDAMTIGFMSKAELDDVITRLDAV